MFQLVPGIESCAQSRPETEDMLKLVIRSVEICDNVGQGLLLGRFRVVHVVVRSI